MLFALLLVSALGCGLIGGVFFAFSSFVMGALARLPPAQGIAAMQSINIVVINPVFLLAFMGTAVGCGALAVLSLLAWTTPGGIYVLAGCALYLIGTILVTMACNVPLNDRLAAINASSAEGAALWAHYVQRWTAWNHVRTAAALAASVAFMAALSLLAPAAAP